VQVTGLLPEQPIGPAPAGTAASTAQAETEDRSARRTTAFRLAITARGLAAATFLPWWSLDPVMSASRLVRPAFH
jgi:hypothetical protein